MKKRIYLHLFLVGLVCILVTALVCAFASWQTTKQQTLYDLQQTAQVLGLEMDAHDDHFRIVRRAAKAAPDLRFTWIQKDGKVLYDSYEPAENMPNHKDRPEVASAIGEGQGVDARHSATRGEVTLYAAQKLQDGSILRVARTQTELFRPLEQLLPWWIVSLLLLIAICQFTVRRLTQGLLDPLEQATRYLSQIGQGDTTEEEKQLFHTSYPELLPFLATIDRQGKQLSKSLHQLEQDRNTMKRITDNLKEGVILLDDQMRIQWINAWGLQLLQKDESLSPFRQQLLGKFLMPLLPEGARLSTERTKVNKPDTWTMKLRKRQYQLTLRPLEPPQERATRILIIMDITEEREREQLRRDFTANVTHELKTPLTSISGFAELMAAGMYQKKEDITHFGHLICQEAKRLLEMINSIIFLSRIEEVPSDALQEAVPLGGLIRSVVEFMEPFCKDKKVTIHCKLTEDKVRGSSSMLREMAMNLIDNGVKYNRPGGHVYVTMWRDAGQHQVVLTVRDTGIGIPEDVQERVFERFYRVDESRNKKSGGSGLGLSIVKHIVEQHRGTIEMTSRVNEGTTFVIRLPEA
ncbi:cell wall metabolism sensor histidine kinase WalK [Acidaminococcus timonensis]|uniref:sensor histidine kinase n=1 Tax=Acidaminococcus timonensis TaxID=1871002 RepID=UPI0026F301E5|nr:ATP-binding protein [Acidaminococcus timonensis]